MSVKVNFVHIPDELRRSATFCVWKMTGNNILTARYLRENSFEFKPQFKLFIDTNHLPQISDMTLFESDRIKIIPFNRHFTAEERDIDLKSFLPSPKTYPVSSIGALRGSGCICRKVLKCRTLWRWQQEIIVSSLTVL